MVNNRQGGSPSNMEERMFWPGFPLETPTTRLSKGLDEQLKPRETALKITQLWKAARSKKQFKC